MNNRRCPKCGFPRESETGNGVCPFCGWNYSAGYEVVELTNNKEMSTTIVRLHSGNDIFYEYAPDSTPLYEDAWGKYYLGKCHSKKDFRFLKKVTVCLTNSYSYYYMASMWRHIKEKHIDFSGTAFLPIIDFISCSPNHHYLIEDYYDGVSLYDLMRGKVCGVDDQPIEFAIEMYEMYQNRKIDFAKMVVKEILKEINTIHNNDMALRFIELPENIIFTVNGEIKIRSRGSLMSVCKLRGTISPDVFYSLWPIEYAPPEKFTTENNNESSEVYVIGILLYYILTGHLPYKSSTSLEVCHKAHEPYVDPRDDNYQEKPHFRLSCDFDVLLLNEIQDVHIKKVVEKATRIDPSKRFQSATEFMKALEDVENVHIPWHRRIFSFFKNKGGWSPYVLLTVILTLSVCPASIAQNTMRINYKDGSVYDVPIERIDNVTFIEKVSDRPHEASLVGEWFWGNKEKGYYEVLTLKEDRTYTGYDYYLDYGFDTMTYGTYMNNGIMLNLWSNGYGYRRTYRWFVTALTDNALEVMTQMGSFTYYRVQSEVYPLRVGEESYACVGQDYYVFTDGARVTDIDGKLKGISEGTSYVLRYNAASGLVKAYKVIVKQ